MNSSGKGFIHLFLILIVSLLVVGVLVFVFLKNGQVRIVDTSKTVLISPTVADPESSVNNKTDNWPTYMNSSGYSIKYPPSFNTQDADYGVGLEGATNNSRVLYFYDSNSKDNAYFERYLGLDLWYQDKDYNDLQTVDEVEINGKMIVGKASHNEGYVVYLIKLKNGRTLEVEVSNNADKKETAYQMLSTLSVAK